MEDLDHTLPAYDKHYVADNTLMTDWYPQRVIAMASGGSFLDLGLGHGHAIVRLAQHFQRYHVVEGSQAMIDRFRRRFAELRMEITRSFFEDFDTRERFDNIGMGFVLEHVDDPGLILRRYRQYLQPGGSVFVAVPNCESLHRRFGHEAGLLPDITKLSQADLDLGHQRYFSVRTLEALVRDSGYQVLATEGIFLKPITSRQMEELGMSPEILQAMLKVGVSYPELSNGILMKIRPT